MAYGTETTHCWMDNERTVENKGKLLSQSTAKEGRETYLRFHPRNSGICNCKKDMKRKVLEIFII
jgi:hypothetical protein